MESTNSNKSKTFLRVLKKIMIFTLVLIGGYLAIGYLLHLVIFPEEKPDISSYFKPGQHMNSKAEGVRQTIVKQENGFVFCSLEIFPHADGPPKHIHANFDETFEIENGELSVLVNAEVKKLQVGEQLHIAKGVPHKPYNETSDTIRMKGAIAFPEKFAFGLVQVYGLMDNHPEFGKLPAMLFMMAPLQQSGFDSWLAEGPPVFIQKTMSFFLTPAARMMGYKSYYEEYDELVTNNN